MYLCSQKLKGNTMKQFNDVQCRYGAPMGRPTSPGLGDTCKVRVFRVRMVDGDYDDGGAYWGGSPAAPLYCVRNEDRDVELFYRAVTRAQAIIFLLDGHPHLTPLRGAR